MARETILEETTLDGFVEQEPGLMGFDTNVENGLVAGETYRVIWDNDEYSCTAVEVEAGVVAIGNLVLGGLEGGNNEPFLMFTMQLDENAYMFAIVTEQEGSSHTVAIYQGQNDGIVIKSPLGKSITYGEYDKILINRASGAKTIYSMGEAENATIELDFSNGDMVVEPDNGKLWNEVNIVKPETLVSENIIKDVEIAGVVGSFQAPVSVETIVELDFSAGNMEVVSDDGSVFSKVDILKPTTLIPENIIKDVEIAGVVGTHSGGSESSDGAVKSKAVNFYDVYGNIVYSYTRAEAAALTELPEIPELDGYEALKWNKTLADVQGTVAFLDVGARYSKNGVPACIAIINVTTSSLTLNLYHNNSYSVSGTSATVDWGDGKTSNVTLSSTNTTYSASHTYSQKGQYVVGIIHENITSIYLGKYNTTTSSAITGNQFVDGAYNANQLLSCSGGAMCGNSAFYQCMFLKYLDMDLRNNYYACYRCYRLEVNSYGEASTYLRYKPHHYNTSLKRVSAYLNSSNIFGTGINDGAVIDDIVCSTGSNIYLSGAFVRRLIITGSTPGYFDKGIGTGCLEGIYVPDGAVSSFKSNSYWSSYASYIKPLSEYPDY